jgi:peroxiredoxin
VSPVSAERRISGGGGGTSCARRTNSLIAALKVIPLAAAYVCANRWMSSSRVRLVRIGIFYTIVHTLHIFICWHMERLCHYGCSMKWRSLEESATSTDSRPLREIFAERKELIGKYVPPETQAIHARAVAELKARRLAANILAVGAKAPQFELLDHNEKTVPSSDLLNKGPLVLCFIRGRWCPFCVGQMEAMNQIVPQIEQAGAVLIAISPQTVKQSFFMHDQHKLRFPLLSDAGNNLARRFGLTYSVIEEQRALYQSTFVNLPFVNGDSSWELPIPAIYIVDRDGTVLFAWANEDYTDRPEPREIIEALQH